MVMLILCVVLSVVGALVVNFTLLRGIDRYFKFVALTIVVTLACLMSLFITSFAQCALETYEEELKEEQVVYENPYAIIKIHSTYYVYEKTAEPGEFRKTSLGTSGDIKRDKDQTTVVVKTFVTKTVKPNWITAWGSYNRTGDTPRHEIWIPADILFEEVN